MTGKLPWLAWRIGWQGTAPILILFIVIYAWADYSPVEYDGRAYPAWADGLGWCMTLTSIIFVPIIAAKKLYYDADGTFCEVCLLYA